MTRGFLPGVGNSGGKPAWSRCLLVPPGGFDQQGIRAAARGRRISRAVERQPNSSL